MIEIYRVRFLLSVQLAVWGVVSVSAGIGLLLTENAMLRGIGLQACIWGGVNGVLALTGMIRSWVHARQGPDEYRATRDTVRLRRLLRINARLDVIYILAGITLAVVFRDHPFVLGNGIGVVVQGLFLLLFDAIHARRLPAQTPAWYDPAV